MRALAFCVILALTPAAYGQITNGRVAAPSTLSGRTATPSDVDAATQLLMFQSVQSANADLRDMLATMQRENQRRQGLRNAAAAMRAQQQALQGQLRSEYAQQQGRGGLPPSPCRFADYQHYCACLTQVSTKLAHVPPAQRQQLDTELDALRDQMDSNADLTDQLSLNLQIYQDRLSRVIETLSEVERRIHETNSAIISNQK